MNKILLFLITLLPFGTLAQSNEPPSVLHGLGEVKDAFLNSTNLFIAPYGIFDATKHSGGAGAALVYNVTPNVGTFLRYDYINRTLYKTSGGAQLQLPIPVHLFSRDWTIIPFIFTGLEIPVAGKGKANGSFNNISGTGAAIRISSRFDLIGDVEKSTGDTQYRFGLMYRFRKS